MMRTKIDYNFWNNWGNKTPIEKKAISKIKIARKLIIQAVPKEELVAIYVKGSFVRREMRKGSDIDIVPVVTKNSLEGAIFEINSRIIAPAIVVPLSLEEFKANKLFTKSGFTLDLRAEPDLFLKKLNNYELIYGKTLNPNDFPIRTDKQVVRNEIKKIREGYIKAYKLEKSSSPPIKELFWLVEYVQLSKGNKVKHSFKGIANSVKDSNHIIHEAYRLRLKEKRLTNKDKAQFIKHLKEYLNSIEKEFG